MALALALALAIDGRALKVSPSLRVCRVELVPGAIGPRPCAVT